MQGLPVFHVLAGPRLIGVMVSMLCLMILFDLVAVVGGFLTIWAVSGIAIGNFFINLASAFRWQDFLVVGLKGVVFGLIIPVVCIYHGLKAEGNITSVPPRVSQALVDCLAYMVVFSILISTTLIR
jgi:phospholipid/cholesterol/gamma-HCH transport system permease protein